MKFEPVMASVRLEERKNNMATIDKVTYKITAELDLKKIVAESREVAQALNEFADDLERIEKKYAEPQESEEQA